MASNHYQATMTPDLPAAVFSEFDLHALNAACGLRCEGDDLLYFYAEECFSEEGEDHEGNWFNGLSLLQEKLRHLDPSAYPRIVIEGAATCSKMRPGEFGGFAFLITRDEIRYMATWQWIHEQTR
jgi:hypothetical protein